MRHRKAGKELSRNTSHRRAMLRNMVTSLFRHEQIETTDAKAKAIRPVAEKMITLAKRGDLHARRQALSYMQEKSVTHRLFEELKERYLDRQGGYVRIVKKGFRKGDGAPVSIIQLLPAEEGKKEKKKKGKKKKADKAPSVKAVKGTKKTAASASEKEETPKIKEAVEPGDSENTAEKPKGSEEA
jgi:large subunit ribosomal protein L17